MSFTVRSLIAAGVAFLVAAPAVAQLPPDAVQLDKVKISEEQKSTDLCPVHLVPSDPELPTWEHDGVEYRGHIADECKAEFMTAPDKYAAQAAEARYINNFTQQMSTIWCPVTDEITPGGMTQWEKEGLTWESCCEFCDVSVADTDFPPALERLKLRAKKSFELTGGKYSEGHTSPVEGAIDFGAPAGGGATTSESTESGGHDHGSHDHSSHDHGSHDHGEEKQVADAGTPEAAGETSETEAGASTETGDAASDLPEYLQGKELAATYHGGVGFIFEQRCIECHQPSGMAPMEFTSPEAIRKWTKSMKESIQTRTMPPWPADPHVGIFANSRYLTDREMDLLIEWADAGFPVGEGDFKSAAAEAGEWIIGEPDTVFEVPEYTLGEDETSVAKEFEIETDFDETRYIVASQVRPGDEFTVTAVEAGPLGAFYPGTSPDRFSEEYPRALEPGETVKVRIHNAKEAGYELPVPPTKIAVQFAEDPAKVEQAIQVQKIENTDFTIPAGAEAFEAEATYEFPHAGEIHSIRPVMNQRGKSFTATLVQPDGTEVPLVSIPRWDPAWKLNYQLAEPIDVPAGAKIVIQGVYDNSALNAKNPDPSVDVEAGSGEVLEAWLGYTLEEN